ncbi:hypothetical protein NECAME_02232 [Necator americanus]|uniref:Sin3 C-terminal domain-containing protein n=1 Tax=Necator americanus TaxID=51031 RepID=W2THX0_NECAM|nr:hypothetical protein NECAME_02232 [Necator americanus]ETN81189.1 hypothetical protein NECAME_02232 [Necator americanus]
MSDGEENNDPLIDEALPPKKRRMLLFPVDGYLVITIDKLIAMVGRQLHFLATGADGLETMKLYQKFRYEQPISVFSQSLKKARIEEEYARSAETFFNCQNCFKIFVIYEKKPVVTIELVDTETEEEPVEDDTAQTCEDVAPEASSGDESEEVDEEHRQGSERAGPMKQNGLSTRARAAGAPNSGVPRSSRCTSATTRRSIPELDHVVIRFIESVTGRLFLRRNARMRNADIAGEFVVVGGVSPTRSTYTWEGIIRRKRCSGLSFMERMHYIRKCRAGEMFAEEHGVTWLAKGMQKSRSHHPVYKFLQYNKYLLKNTSRSARLLSQRVS